MTLARMATPKKCRLKLSTMRVIRMAVSGSFCNEVDLTLDLLPGFRSIRNVSKPVSDVIGEEQVITENTLR